MECDTSESRQGAVQEAHLKRTAEAIRAFALCLAKTPHSDPPAETGQVIREVATTGTLAPQYPWRHFKLCLAMHMERLLRQMYGEEQEKAKEKEFQRGLQYANSQAEAFFVEVGAMANVLMEFPAPPFTLKRLCEILSTPKRYANARKMCNALGKVVCVTSVLPVDEHHPLAPSSVQGNENGSVGPHGPVPVDVRGPSSSSAAAEGAATGGETGADDQRVGQKRKLEGT
uniref:Uncharacterized protein n=1 Tax=Chromera velia CCMP2878 TaxID=1169474 RepID=A0A0G4FYS8_9ALVE|mmetsp:Transcript_11389/g.21940  ORF Transcript_11389/g.21940 Transcript_11389/m.21940 type:complete len:229 (-) Transcript_11389:252-938(-)|eukprot:Cvel_19425.t1-p1 / transcript=Cvel_19425.t1 / gene=Cvel_19425 / organism=Chromera_velia_CCMP2878 / gene_product=hypothetical protein / transcript_product=hypothetical protein / location=Cvel_scaffold1673:25449-26132(-) / protein_length=228 / sequence_SO=supercontig / SO=protein_coding / is_pseudo=false